jgi:hypothetical protein
VECGAGARCRTEPGEVHQLSAWGEGDDASKECSSRFCYAGGVRDDLGECHDGQREKEWEKWQTRESKAQGMLKASVSLAIKLNLDVLKSARDMWTHCEHVHALNIVENNERFEGNSTHWISKMTRRLRRSRPTWSCSRGWSWRRSW